MHLKMYLFLGLGLLALGTFVTWINVYTQFYSLPAASLAWGDAGGFSVGIGGSVCRDDDVVDCGFLIGRPSGFDLYGADHFAF